MSQTLADNHEWRDGCQHMDGNTRLHFGSLHKYYVMSYYTEKSAKEEKTAELLQETFSATATNKKRHYLDRRGL